MGAVKSRAAWRPMSSDERMMAIALGGCSMPCASSQKRFRNTLWDQAHEAEPRITDAQLGYLRLMLRRFRRQVRASQLPAAARWLLDETIPLLDAPLLAARSGDNSSCDAPTAARQESAPEAVRVGPGQLSLLEVAHG